MAPSEHVTHMDIGGKVKEGRNFMGCLVRGACKSCVVNMMSGFSTERMMAGHSPLSREVSKERCNYSQCGGRSFGGLGKEVEEIRSPREGGDNLGERWFNMENSQVKRRSLVYLEHDLDASLLFEHGGGQGGGLRCVSLVRALSDSHPTWVVVQGTSSYR